MLALAAILTALASFASALVHGTDSSTLVSVATFTKAKSEGFTKAIPRGYQQTGRVDPNFAQTYKNARAAGITNIDTYLFPCTGSGRSCPTYASQFAALGDVFTANNMAIGTIWIDLEVSGSNWNYGTSGNLAQAKAIVAAGKAGGWNIGIYSSPGEWSQMFGSYAPVVDNSIPLWFATYNDAQTLTLGTPFGGWSKAVGHQYTDQSASGQFDLNVFAN